MYDNILFYTSNITTATEYWVYDHLVDGYELNTFEEAWELLEQRIRDRMRLMVTPGMLEDAVQEAAIALWALFQDPGTLKNKLKPIRNKTKWMEYYACYTGRAACDAGVTGIEKRSISLDATWNPDEYFEYSYNFVKACQLHTGSGKNGPHAAWTQIVDRKIDFEIALEMTLDQIIEKPNPRESFQQSRIDIVEIMREMYETGESFVQTAEPYSRASGRSMGSYNRAYLNVKQIFIRHYYRPVYKRTYGKLTTKMCQNGNCTNYIPERRVYMGKIRGHEPKYCSAVCRKEARRRRKWQAERRKAMKLRQNRRKRARAKRALARREAEALAQQMALLGDIAAR